MRITANMALRAAVLETYSMMTKVANLKEDILSDPIADYCLEYSEEASFLSG